VFVEGKSALSTNRDLPGGRRALDDDHVALQQLFADVALPLGDNAKLTIRPGRQELRFGSQRLVSPLDWANTRRTWDGVSAKLDVADWAITGFFTYFAPVQKYQFNDSVEANNFYGVFAQGACPLTGLKADLYWLGLERENVAFNGTAGTEKRHTLGGRLYGPIGESPFDIDIEGAYQCGEVGMGDINAFMIAVQAGYKFVDGPWSPRLFVGVDYASGDEGAGGDVETFNQLFPLGHKYLGFADAIGRQNIIDVNMGLSVKPMKKLTGMLVGHVFWRADRDDALYNVGGGAYGGRAVGAGTDTFVGAEIDLLVKYQFDAHLTLLGGYSHFFAEDYLEQTGAGSDVDFVYFSVQYTF